MSASSVPGSLGAGDLKETKENSLPSELHEGGEI